MRPDQIQRLQDLSEQLADRFITDADPANWSGEGKLPCDMDQQQRGDAYWCKKNAMATGGVLKYTLDLIKFNETAGATPGDDASREADLERKIRDAEQQAAKAMARVMDTAKGKAAFDKRVHKNKA